MVIKKNRALSKLLMKPKSCFSVLAKKQKKLKELLLKIAKYVLIQLALIQGNLKAKRVS
jgi:hypothetical protein